MHQILSMQPAFSIKANLQAISYIYLKTLDLHSLTSQLTTQQNQAPKFLNGAIVVIDFTHYHKKLTALELIKAINLLQSFAINPLGFANASKQQAQVIQQHSALTLFNKNTSTIKDSTKENKNKTIQHIGPVRSGQKVQNLQGDLIIIGSVNPGAEIIASGNIHLYGKLSGKALAGAYGNKPAKIFAQSIKAELISIAGIYQNAEKINQQKAACMVQIAENNNLEIIAL